MPDRTAAYWEEQAARAIESASKATTTELRLAFLEIAKNYREIAAHTLELDQWRQKSRLLSLFDLPAKSRQDICNPLRHSRVCSGPCDAAELDRGLQLRDLIQHVQPSRGA
jgi:hypothetical protein